MHSISVIAVAVGLLASQTTARIALGNDLNGNSKLSHLQSVLMS
jgi:hypothetical protein